MAQIDAEILEAKRAQVMAQLEQVIGQANWLRGQLAALDELIVMLKGDAVTPTKDGVEDTNNGKSGNR